MYEPTTDPARMSAWERKTRLVQLFPGDVSIYLVPLYKWTKMESGEYEYMRYGTGLGVFKGQKLEFACTDWNNKLSSTVYRVAVSDAKSLIRWELR